MNTIDKTLILENSKKLLGIKGNDHDEILNVFIDVAIGKLLELRYPFDYSIDESKIPSRWNSWLTRAVQSIYESQGQHNITQFSQNGVQITYSRMEEGIDIGLIDSVVPLAGSPNDYKDT